MHKNMILTMFVAFMMMLFMHGTCCDAWLHYSSNLHQRPKYERRHHAQTTYSKGVGPYNSYPTYTHTLFLNDERLLLDDVGTSPIVVAGVALVLLIASQTFINQMLKGDQGLGAFLKDGSGYNKSGFQSGGDNDTKTDTDPLPWLKLPQLDFVEVAGQTPTSQQIQNDADVDAISHQLEALRKEMNEKLEQGNVAEATLIKEELERFMKDNGFKYNSDS